MVVAEGTETFLSALFRSADYGAAVEIRNVPGKSIYVNPHEGNFLQLEDLQYGDWYFGTTIRSSKGEIVGGTLAWCDIDLSKIEDVEDLGPLFPEPSTIVSSGHGTHMYWVVDRMIESMAAVRLSLLATLAFEGDPKVCEPRRVMRLPGSFNRKKAEERQCTVVRESFAQYAPEYLEECLIARLLHPLWTEGMRNKLILGISAILARADWGEERLKSVVRMICSLADDTEVSNRLTTAITTLQKRGLGLAISAQDLREILGDKYGKLLEALGITARNGDLMLAGETIGKMDTLERDMVNYFAALPDWSYFEGAIAHWSGNRWVTSTPEELTTVVFNTMAKMTVVLNGDEAEFNITAKLARAIAQVVAGGLSAKPLPPMPPNLLPLANGVLDLESLEMRPHGPENLNRWFLPHTFDPVAECPNWKKFLIEAVPHEAEWLQQWTGYCLSDGNPFERMAWLYGPPGTGKSTFIKALTKLFADSAVAIAAERVGEYTVASLAGKRLAVCTEISSAMLKTVVLKQLISGDPTDARHPYGRPFSVAFSGKFMFASNVLPPVDQGEGLWRRLAIIAFDNKPRVSDPLLQQKLDLEMSGILNWALEGRTQLAAIGGTWELPQRILTLVGEYQESSDLFSQFVAEELELDADSEISGKELYARYSYWMREHGQIAEPFGTIFWHNLKLSGLTTLAPRRIGGRITRMWRGARLVADTFLSK